MAAGQQVLMRALMLRGHAAGPASLSTIRHVRTQARAIRVVVVSLARRGRRSWYRTCAKVKRKAATESRQLRDP